MRQMIRRAAAAAIAAVILASGAPVRAATPPDTLVQAWQFDDIITLDPAEIFEFSASELAGNTYERLITYDYEDVSKVSGEVAESWTVSPDGKTFTFRIRQGKKFASGNPITAADVVFSLQRTILLDKSPAFIIAQFGFTKDNVKDKIKQVGPFEFTMALDKAYAPTFVLYCLTSSAASIVDKKLVMQHEAGGDLGHGWLRTHYAGSGPLTIRDWKPNEVIVLERNPNYEKPTPLARVIYRHIKEPATQRLLLEKGDVDVARNLTPEDINAVSKSDDIRVQSGPQGLIYYLGLNQKNPILAKPEVRQALKYLVDYDAISDTIWKHKAKVHQTFLPSGFLGALNEVPYKLDVAKAKELLAKAGFKDGFSVTMDTRSTPEITGVAQAIQQTFAQAGVKLEIVPGDGKQTLTKYRERRHDIYIGPWGPDYQDPNTNADTFAANDDNSDAATAKPVSWRNAWDPGPLTAKTRAAALEKDPEVRAETYRDLQRAILADSPYVILSQQVEVLAVRKNVEGIRVGPSFDIKTVTQARKN